ncbi:MAG TPA: transglutaminase family protein [Pirellulales bacterium]|nr:transglutaminase family protein [Pirellulales bacterium]
MWSRCAQVVLPWLFVTVIVGCGETAPRARREAWDIYFMQGTKIGYGHVAQTPDNRNGLPATKTVAETSLAMQRFGQQTAMRIDCTSWESLDGRLLEFECTTRLGPSPQTTRGGVVGDTLRIETQPAAGQPARPPTVLPITKPLGGFNAIDDSLARQPMQPGQRRTIESIWPVINRPATTVLVARDVETTDLLRGTAKLLRIEASTQLPGSPPIDSVLWADERGEVLKNRIESLDQTAYRTSREVAIGHDVNRAAGGAAGFDLGWSSLVKVSPPIPDAHATRRVRYAVELAGGNPTEAFVSDAGQHVERSGPHSAEITVVAVRPDTPIDAMAVAADPPIAADRQPSALVQSDDPRVVAMAKEAAGDEKDPWALAQRLEAFVHGKIRAKNFSQAFASAAEVAATLEGDCSEHAVLLAALARARGLPARVALGLVYVEAESAFGFHMWTETYVVDRWIAMDATLGRGGIGAAHLKLGTTRLADGDALASFLRVAQVLGRLKIRVLDVER